MPLEEHGTTDSFPSKTDEKYKRTAFKIFGNGPTASNTWRNTYSRKSTQIRLKQQESAVLECLFFFPLPGQQTKTSLHTGAAKIIGLPYSQLPNVALFLEEVNIFHPAPPQVAACLLRLSSRWMQLSDRGSLLPSSLHSWDGDCLGLDTSENIRAAIGPAPAWKTAIPHSREEDWGLKLLWLPTLSFTKTSAPKEHHSERTTPIQARRFHCWILPNTERIINTNSS